MDARFAHSPETRIEVVRLSDAGFGYRSIAGQLSIPPNTVRIWLRKHRQGLSLGLSVVSNTSYSTQLKVAAVEAFLAGMSKSDVLVKYGINNMAVLDRWVRTYRDGGPDSLLPKPKGRPRKVSRPETLEEENARLRMEVAVLKKLEALMIQGDPRFWEKPGSSSH